MSLALFMDIAVLAFLAATVLMGFNLSMSLRNFRESRFEMEGLLNRLTSHIDRAENAIAGLQNATKNSGVQLQGVVNDSKFLTDELKFMNEAGNSLADRLEKLAEKNRALIEKMEQAGGIGPGGYAPQAQAAPYKNAGLPTDFDEIEALMHADEYDDDYPQQNFQQGDIPPLQSQAERELYEALTRGQSGKRAGIRG